jgi:hypothetical protein
MALIAAQVDNHDFGPQCWDTSCGVGVVVERISCNVFQFVFTVHRSFVARIIFEWQRAGVRPVFMPCGSMALETSACYCANGLVCGAHLPGPFRTHAGHPLRDTTFLLVDWCVSRLLNCHVLRCFSPLPNTGVFELLPNYRV